MIPFYSEKEKIQWIAHNCNQCSVLFMCNLSTFVNIGNVSDKMANEHIGIGFDGFLEPNCKSKLKN